MKKFKFTGFLIIFVLLVLAIDPASANAPTNNLSQNIINTYRNAANQWLPLITAYAQRLFWILAILDFTWMAAMLILKNGDLYDLVFNLVRKILLFGFFYALILNGNAWMTALVNSFRTIAANVPGGAGQIFPGTILETSFDVFMAAADKVAMMSPKSWVMGVMGIGVVVIGALMTGVQVIALIEMYIGLVIGQIVLGFGGSEWSKDYAISYVKYIISIGMKLMAIQLIAALANNMFTVWANIPPAQFDLAQVAALAVAMILLFFIMKTVPEIISGIISGGQFGSNPVSVLGSAAAMGAGAIMGGVGLAAGGVGGAARSLAVLQEATKAPGNTGGIAGTIKTVAGAGARTFADNMGKAKAFRAPIIGGTFGELYKARTQPPEGSAPPSPENKIPGVN